MEMIQLARTFSLITLTMATQKKHNDAWENTFSKAFYHKVHCSSKLSGTVRVKFLTRHLLNV